MADKIKSQPGNEGQSFFSRLLGGGKKMSKPSSRGPGRIQRSKSGGAVKGKIPHAGGSNKTNFETGVTSIKYGKEK
jgi:hypothetical protein